MNRIIENQKIKSFLKKMDLEWPDKIERVSFKTEDLVFVHLRDDISPVEFAKSLMPKVKVFIDFYTPLKICLLNTEGEGNISIVFNQVA